jgi:hypothetical protein
MQHKKAEPTMNKLKSTVLIATSILVLAQAAPAAINKDYAGTECVEMSDTTPEISYSFDAQAENTSSSRTTFLCPATQQGGTVQSAYVRALDRHPTENVECRVMSMHIDGSIGFFSGFASSAGSSGGFTISFGALGGVNTVGTKYFQCAVPGVSGSARSGVATYSITEQ